MKAFIAFVRRPEITTLILFACVLVSGPVLAQGDPGPNVNLIGLTLDPNDYPDASFRQQNEPSCALRPDDSACIICAYNDYRAVDDIGDAWQGVSQSCDAGNSWLSRLAPGSKLDTVAPVPAAFAADPRFQHIPGLAILNFIAGFRDSNAGVLAIQHWLPVNKEDADHYEPDRETYIADAGTDGRFIDKPDMLAVLDPANNKQGTIFLSHMMENQSLGDENTPGMITRGYPTGKLFVGYAVFTGSNSVKVLVKVSEDWGQTWPNQVIKLSEDQNEVSGLSLTANKSGSKVLAIWRRRGDNNNPDAIMYSVISQQGNNLKATKGEVLAEVCAFDQPTLGGTETPDFPLVAFRTNDFPWAASDGDNFFVFYSDLGKTDGTCNAFPFPEDGMPARPRIVVHHSPTGASWSNPIVVDDHYNSSDIESAHPESFQFMPSAFGANGRVQLAWYDTRREAFEIGSLPFNQQVPYVADHLDGPPDAFFAIVQRKVDVYTTSMTIDQVEAAQANQADGDPLNDFDGGIPDPVRVTQYSIVVNDGESLETEASFANKKMFGQGTLPFLGDYIAVAARQFRKVAGGDPDNVKYESNTDFFGGLEDFFVAWTSNRDVDGDIPTIGAALPYTADNAPEGEPVDGEPDSGQMFAGAESPVDSLPPRDAAFIAEGIDGGDPDAIGTCSPNGTSEGNFDRSRDANIYGSVIKDRVRLFAPTTNKPLGGVMRAFAVSVANAENSDQTFWLTIDNQPCSDPKACRATFRQEPFTPPFNNTADWPSNNPGLLIEEVTVPANSTLARTVFIVGTAETSVRVLAREGGPTGTPISSVELGNTSTFLDPDICASGDCSVADSELHNLTLGNLTLGNLTLGNVELIAEAIRNLTLGNLTLGNLTLGNLTLGNLTLGNLTLGNLTLGNATLANTTLVNMALEEGTGLTLTSSYEELLIWALDPANGVDPALLDPTVLALTLAKDENGDGIIDNPEELLNLTLGNLTLGNLTLGNLTLGNLTLGNLTLGNASSPNLTLGNLTLGNTSLGNLTLGNAALVDPVLTTTYKNSEACVPGEDGGCTDLAFDDYTYPITNKGNVTTALSVDITIDGEVAATQLIAWKANVTATSIDCQGQLVLEEGVQVVVNNPNQNLNIATISAPFKGDATIVAGAGETVFVTYRVWATPPQLMKVKVSGFTASSQAANCWLEFDEVRQEFINNCSPELSTDVEQIIVDGPPVLTINPEGDQTLKATSPAGAVYTFTATAFDVVDDIKLDEGNRDVTCDRPFTNTYPVGEDVVTCRAFDSAGNEGIASFTVTVEEGNVAPVLNTVGDQSVNELALLSFTATATDADLLPEPLTFSLGGTVPTGASITTGGDFTWTPTEAQGPGSYTFDVVVTDDGTDGTDTLNDSETITVTVNEVNAAPVLAAITTPRSVNELALLSFTATATDADLPADTLTFSLGGTVPAGAAITAAGGFTWTPTEAQGPGSYTFDVVVTDDGTPNLFDSQSITVNVGETNSAPVLVPITTPQSINELALLSFTATAMDSGDIPANLLMFSLSGTVPAGAAITPNGDFTWTPTEAQGPGSYTFDVMVTDNGLPNLSASRSITVNVGETNSAPVLAAITTPQSVNELALLSFTATATDPGDDPANVLTFSLADGAGGSVPTGASIDSVSGVFSWTPTEAQGGQDYTFDVVVTDDGTPNLSASQSITVTVDEAPVITVVGNNPDTVVEDSGTYSDPGATATDDVDGSVSVTASGWDGDTSEPGDYTIYYDAVDSAGNAAAQQSRIVTVLFMYDIDLIPPKGRVRAGSTVPLDWQYLDRLSGDPVDSSGIPVAVTWEHWADDRCLTDPDPLPTDGSSTVIDTDSGNSDFRYSSSNDTWQFSWQTPDGAFGPHKVSISPPGGDFADAWECINLR